MRRSLGDLSDLVGSIREVGVLTPVTVTPKASGGEWRLVAGHRRTPAAEEVGLETAPALVHTAAGAEERLLATLVENLQRLDLDPVEKAGEYRSLVDAGWSQAEVARRVRRSRGHVSRRLRILTLPAEVQERVAEGTVTVEYAYTLSRLVDKGVDADDVAVAADTAPSTRPPGCWRSRLPSVGSTAGASSSGWHQGGSGGPAAPRRVRPAGELDASGR